MWIDSDFDLCQKIQNLVFPKGVEWDKNICNYRTIVENEVFSIFYKISDTYEDVENKNGSENTDPSLFVRLKGLEPPRREAPDPKSGAATNYATAAQLW